MKRVLATVLTVCMMVTLFIPGNMSLAKAIDEGALEAFLEEFSRVHESNRKAGVGILKAYLEDGQNGIEDLKRDLNIYLNEDHIKIIEKKGYTLDDVKRELDKLESWSMADRMKLLDYLRKGDSAGIRNLIKSVESEPSSGGSNDSSTTAPSTGGGGGGSSSGSDKKGPKKEEPKKEELLEVHFKDIENHKNKDEIIFLAQRGIIEGKTKERFDPDGELTRAEFMTLIQRLLGLKPKEDKTLPFKDVKVDSWYYEYVKAAFDNGIIEGTSPTTFKPNDKVTREQMVAIIIRILEDKELIHTLESVDKDLEMFEDSNQVSKWAREYMFYGVKYGIIDGRDENNLIPGQPATRGEAANIIKILYDILEKQGQ